MTLDLNNIVANMLHHRQNTIGTGEPISPPIVQASTYKLPAVPEGEYQYGRVSNPTWSAAEQAIALLEDADVVAFPSGMAAISAVLLTTMRPGETLLLPSDGYYVSRLVAQKILAPMGVLIDECPSLEYDSRDFNDYKLVMVETPSNPKLDICDLQAMAAKCQAAGALLMVDNTTMTPLGQRPLDLGADIVVSADTKALNGHSDALFGHVASRNAEFIDGIREWRTISGSIVGAHDAWLVHRGLETLEIRYERMCANAGIIAARLAAHGAVESVVYPGLESHAGHELAKAQMLTFGTILGVTFKDVATAEAFIDGSKYIVAATSFGGVHTSAERRARWGDDVADSYVRLSLGIEPTEALWADMLRSLDAL
ncbi:MAG: cystathionine gamma-lyase [Hyphomicrobiales bacterium]|nr:MAG: cystathionine gamma-lyase [Hyphomicrobiales bacterium]